MEKFLIKSDFFTAKDTLECGQIFRYVPENAGYRVYSKDKACLITPCEDGQIITSEDADYFRVFFDEGRDYSSIYNSALSSDNEFLKKSATSGKGVRILKQDAEEALFSFIISQNNNIPRIKGIIERLCSAIGERKIFMDKEYFTFPKATEIAQKPVDFYKSIGLGYRAEYFPKVADALIGGFDLKKLGELKTPELKKELIKLKGVGPKVADCVALFGFNRTDSFPVDTWVEKVYRENFSGALSDREKISDYFVSRFKDNSGYFQQYMFHYKRNLQNNL